LKNQIVIKDDVNPLSTMVGIASSNVKFVKNSINVNNLI